MEAAVKKTMLIALTIASTLVAGTAAAQPAPVNQAGVTMGHWHIASKDVEANKKLFVAMGGKLFMPGGQPLIMFPGLYISLILGNEKGDGGSVGSVVNHVGFILDHRQTRVGGGRGGEGEGCDRAARRRTPERRRQPARSGLRRNAGWRAYGDSGRQDADSA